MQGVIDNNQNIMPIYKTKQTTSCKLILYIKLIKNSKINK